MTLEQIFGEPSKVENGVNYWVGDFWTSQQRAAHTIHELPFRACFKPALANFFIQNFSQVGDIVYDPFAGRGTVPVEAALNQRIPAYNDLNPLAKVLTHPRLDSPSEAQITTAMVKIKLDEDYDISGPQYDDLRVFYHPDTLRQLCILKDILNENRGDVAYDWIRMVATTRLSGHSPGYFSVYTLPPNQTCSADSQRKINAKLELVPTKKDVKALILKKSNLLLRNDPPHIAPFAELTNDAANTPEIPDNSIQLTVTSPPFLNVVNYKLDNWLRCWFNDIDIDAIELTNTPKLVDWERKMAEVFDELYRITRPGGYVAFEVGEVNKGKIHLEDTVVDIVNASDFNLEGAMINKQAFTKTSNIWGIENNKKGTNTNRIVVCRK